MNDIYTTELTIGKFTSAFVDLPVDTIFYVDSSATGNQRTTRCIGSKSAATADALMGLYRHRQQTFSSADWLFPFRLECLHSATLSPDLRSLFPDVTATSQLGDSHSDSSALDNLRGQLFVRLLPNSHSANETCAYLAVRIDDLPDHLLADIIEQFLTLVDGINRSVLQGHIGYSDDFQYTWYHDFVISHPLRFSSKLRNLFRFLFGRRKHKSRHIGGNTSYRLDDAPLLMTSFGSAATAMPSFEEEDTAAASEEEDTAAPAFKEYTPQHDSLYDTEPLLYKSTAPKSAAKSAPESAPESAAESATAGTLPDTEPYTDRELRELANRIRNDINELQRRNGINILIELLNGEQLSKLQRQLRTEPSRLVVDDKFRILLPEYDIEVKMPTLSKVIYLLFLRHEEGIRLKELSDYKDELRQIYLTISQRTNLASLNSSIDDLTDVESGSANQKISRIGAALRENLATELAKPYMITGEKGERRHITLNRKYVSLPTELTF